MTKSKSEHQEQAEFVCWFRKNYPGVTIFAIPNGGHRNMSQGIKLKLEGVTPGVWDLFIPDWWMFIEFKRSQSGKLSEHQIKFGYAMVTLGYRCMVAYGADDAIEQITNGERYSWMG